MPKASPFQTESRRCFMLLSLRISRRSTGTHLSWKCFNGEFLVAISQTTEQIIIILPVRILKFLEKPYPIQEIQLICTKILYASLTTAIPPQTTRETVQYNFYLSVDFAEHNVERSQNGGDIRQHMPAVHPVHRLQMGKSRRPDFTPIGFVFPG